MPEESSDVLLFESCVVREGLMAALRLNTPLPGVLALSVELLGELSSDAPVASSCVVKFKGMLVPHLGQGIGPLGYFPFFGLSRKYAAHPGQVSSIVPGLGSLIDSNSSGEI